MWGVGARLRSAWETFSTLHRNSTVFVYKKVLRVINKCPCMDIFLICSTGPRWVVKKYPWGSESWEKITRNLRADTKRCDDLWSFTCCVRSPEKTHGKVMRIFFNAFLVTFARFADKEIDCFLWDLKIFQMKFLKILKKFSFLIWLFFFD